MKILLVTPLSHTVFSARWIPVGLGYIAANLKKHGHSVKLYDRYLQLYYLGNKTLVNESMKAEILKYKPNIIGFSTVSPLIYDTVESIAFIREFFTGTIIAGGHHVTAMPTATLGNIPGLNMIAAGEAEISLVELANGSLPESIPGIFTRRTNTLAFINARISNLDNLPMPDYSIFDMNYYTGANSGTIRGFYLKTAELVSSRGCTNNCSFCSETLTYGKGVRYHSPEYVVENIENLYLDYDINGLYFHDNDFLTSRDHAENICRKIIDKGLHNKIKWAIQAGTNRVDEDILKLLSKAGCVKIEFGMESISDEHLSGINKNRSVGLNEKAISLCKKHHINIHSYFMTGFEGETIEYLLNLMHWLKLYKPHTFSLSQIKMYPGTRLYDTSSNGFFENNPWTEKNIKNFYDTENFSNIKKEDRKEFYNKIFRPFYVNYSRRALIKTNSIRALAKMVISKYFFRR